MDIYSNLIYKFLLFILINTLLLPRDSRPLVKPPACGQTGGSEISGQVRPQLYEAVRDELLLGNGKVQKLLRR